MSGNVGAQLTKWKVWAHAATQDIKLFPIPEKNIKINIQKYKWIKNMRERLDSYQKNGENFGCHWNI